MECEWNGMRMTEDWCSKRYLLNLLALANLRYQLSFHSFVFNPPLKKLRKMESATFFHSASVSYYYYDYVDY